MAAVVESWLTAVARCAPAHNQVFWYKNTSFFPAVNPKTRPDAIFFSTAGMRGKYGRAGLFDAASFGLQDKRRPQEGARQIRHGIQARVSMGEDRLGKGRQSGGAVASIGAKFHASDDHIFHAQGTQLH